MVNAFSHAEYKYRRKEPWWICVLVLADAQQEVLRTFKVSLSAQPPPTHTQNLMAIHVPITM